MTSNKFLRAADVAELLDISIQRVYQFTREGILPAVYLGRLIRYDPEAIQRFCQDGGKRYES